MRGVANTTHNPRESFLCDNLPMSVWIALLMIGLAFALGSLPFSVWLGYAFMRKDVRRYGDHNPGATNVFRAGNRLVGLLALMLDISKAAVPVGIGGRGGKPGQHGSCLELLDIVYEIELL